MLSPDHDTISKQMINNVSVLSQTSCSLTEQHSKFFVSQFSNSFKTFMKQEQLYCVVNGTGANLYLNCFSENFL